MLEGIQNSAIRITVILKIRNYEQKLKELSILPVDIKFHKRDIIQIYKICSVTIKKFQSTKRKSNNNFTAYFRDIIFDRYENPTSANSFNLKYQKFKKMV